jgi:hypothetical protein
MRKINAIKKMSEFGAVTQESNDILQVNLYNDHILETFVDNSDNVFDVKLSYLPSHGVRTYGDIKWFNNLTQAIKYIKGAKLC